MVGTIYKLRHKIQKAHSHTQRWPGRRCPGWLRIQTRRMAEWEKQGLFSNTVRIMEERLYLQWQQKTKKGKSGSKLQWSWVLTLHREAVGEEDRCPPPTPYLTYHPGSSGFLASSTFSGNSCLSSHVTLTPAQLPEKARLYLQTVLPDPGLRRRRHQKRIDQG